MSKKELLPEITEDKLKKLIRKIMIEEMNKLKNGKSFVEPVSTFESAPAQKAENYI